MHEVCLLYLCAYLLARLSSIISNFTSLAFFVSVPSTWNSLPAHIRSLDKLSTFKRQLSLTFFSPLLLSSHPVPAPQIRFTILALNQFSCMYVFTYAVYVQGSMIYTSPVDACSPVEQTPRHLRNTTRWIALVRRNLCSFVQKVGI